MVMQRVVVGAIVPALFDTPRMSWLEEFEIVIEEFGIPCKFIEGYLVMTHYRCYNSSNFCLHRYEDSCS